MSERRESDRRAEGDRREGDRRKGDHGIPEGIEVERREGDRREVERRSAERRVKDTGPPKQKGKGKPASEPDEDDRPVTARELREALAGLGKREGGESDGNPEHNRRAGDRAGAGDSGGGAAEPKPRKPGWLWR
jgi:hypothetical protein